MKRYVAGALVALAAPAVLAASPVARADAATSGTTATVTHAATAASSTAALRCHASMSNNRPKDYTSIYVNVGTVRFAHVTTVAHYKTVNRMHTGTANARGNARIRYYISGATPGYRVVVSVTVRSGNRHGSCSTSFIPHR